MIPGSTSELLKQGYIEGKRSVAIIDIAKASAGLMDGDAGVENRSWTTCMSVLSLLGKGNIILLVVLKKLQGFLRLPKYVIFLLHEGVTSI